MAALAVVVHERKLAGPVKKSLRRALVEAGLDDAPWTFVPKAAKTTAAARKALERGAETVLVCGGDGTVRAGAEALAGTDATLAVLPIGTANLFANALDLPEDPGDVVAAITGGRRRTIDTGVCNDMTFSVMAGTGFDAAMLDDADAGKDRLGMFSYVRAGLRNARDREPMTMKVDVDGERFFEGGATCVLVGNLGTLKGGLEAFPDASPTDGRLDLAVVTAAGIKEWAGVLWSAVRHQQHLSGHAHLTQAATICVKLDGKHRVELDGGTKGTSKRLDFSVRPRSLHICTADG